ncbi:MAG: hypothetical protein ACREBU_14365 [Nitrososphaera sp.]
MCCAPDHTNDLLRACRKKKDLSEFHNDRNSKKDGVGTICRGCKLEYCRVRYGRKTRKEYISDNEMTRRNRMFRGWVAS